MAHPKIENHIFKVQSGDIKTALFISENSTGKLAVVLPGAGYSCKQPLLYYAIKALLQKQFDVLAMDQVYADNGEWAMLNTMESALKIVEDDSGDLFPAIVKKFDREIHTVLGRSLGTYMIACALEKSFLNPEQIVWQTPSLNGKWDIIKKCNIRGLGIIGTADERYQIALPYLPDSTLIIDGADHGMEIPKNPIRSIEILQQVTQTTLEWI